MSISCIRGDLFSNIAQAARRKPGVSPVWWVAFDPRAPALAGRHRIPRGDLAERGCPADLPPDGGALADRPDGELRRRGHAGRGAGRGNEGPARRARPGRGVPAGGRGVPRAHPPASLSEHGEWAILDSNQGPPPYQSGALTS